MLKLYKKKILVDTNGYIIYAYNWHTVQRQRRESPSMLQDMCLLVMDQFFMAKVLTVILLRKVNIGRLTSMTIKLGPHLNKIQRNGQQFQISISQDVHLSRKYTSMHIYYNVIKLILPFGEIMYKFFSHIKNKPMGSGYFKNDQHTPRILFDNVGDGFQCPSSTF